VVIAPPPPPAPPAPPAPPRPAPNRSDIGVACPTQVPPEMPRKALQDGVEGVVRAQVLIKDGVVKDVTIQSGPRVFHAAVRAAMMQYKCTNDGGGEVLATQEFNFKIQ
jgi:periplasmic protein TonB